MSLENLVDLRSDTVTQPTAPMRAAMAAAPLGDDVFGDDPSVNALQNMLAEMLGYEAALFMASGTQSNLCALMSHCQRGDEYIAGAHAHSYLFEAGGGAVLGSIQPQPLPNQPDGSLDLAQVEAAIKPDDIHFARTRLLALENTIGGKVLPMTYLAEATALAKRRGLNTHLDGARLFNAAVSVAATRGGDAYAAAREICKGFDSVSVCLSKGLGAPVGSVLCGSHELIQRAKRIRKMVGGGMRQAGFLAAAGQYALEHHVRRLAEDHALATRLADGLMGAAGLSVEPPQTNIVFATVAPAHMAGLLAHLKSRGVLATGLYQLRFVTHLNVDAEGIDRAVAAVREYMART